MFKNKTIFKKLVSLLLIITMFLTLSTVTAFAADTYVRTESAYNVDETSFSVSAYISFGNSEKISDYETFTFMYSTDSSFYNYDYTNVYGEGNNSFKATITGLEPNTTYYVRAKIQSYTYGTIEDRSYITVTTNKSNSAPTVYTNSVSLKDGEVFAEGTVENSNYVFEKGFVYSDKVKDPTTSDNKVIATTSSARYSYSIAANTTEKIFYVRAYAISDYNNRQTTTYGQTISLNIGDLSPIIKIVETKNITSTTADIYIDIDKNTSMNIKERGVIYSDTAKTPKLNDSNVSSITISGTTGTGNETIKSLKPKTDYYVRAYAKNDSTTIYSEVKTFKTTEDSTVVNITYKTADGNTLGTQEIKTKADEILTTASLKITSGYKLKESSWGYKVLEGKNDLTIIIVPIVVEPVIPVAPVETNFMNGVGNYMFYPEVNATRGEVAQILYNLSADKNYDQSRVKSFPDVTEAYGGTTTSKKAIDFVVARGYMAGMPTGKFEPNALLTRAQLSTVLVQYYDLNLITQGYFPDVEKLDAKGDYWAKKFIYTVSGSKFMNGYPDGNFGPDVPLKRAELAQSFYNAEKMVNNRSDKPLGNQNYIDVAPNHWAYKAIMNISMPK